MIYLVGGWRDGPEGRLLVAEMDREGTQPNTTEQFQP